MRSQLLENVERTRERIATAARRAGRLPDEVRLVAVTKYVDIDLARLLVEAGCNDLGESRPQELSRKAEALADLDIRWHMVGHLQRNKARKTLPHIDLLHSGDNLRLLMELDRFAGEAGRPLDVLLEVNVSGDEAKHGFGLDDIEPLLPELAELTHLRIRGLMAMSGLTASLEEAHGQFEQLRQLRDRLAAIVPANMSVGELSMGMSDDLDPAIAAGATLVRVGSALFEGIIA